jgi:methylmalonyl-CoA/ethylmalonyl-CoA epimerase
MPKITRIDHIAILVDDMSAPLAFWRDALGMEVTQVKDIPAEAAQIAFLPTGGSEIELVRPTTSDSGLAKYLDKRGPGMRSSKPKVSS